MNPLGRSDWQVRTTPSVLPSASERLHRAWNWLRL
jgi:hypothetical protein